MIFLGREKIDQVSFRKQNETFHDRKLALLTINSQLLSRLHLHEVALAVNKVILDDFLCAENLKSLIQLRNGYILEQLGVFSRAVEMYKSSWTIQPCNLRALIKYSESILHFNRTEARSALKRIAAVISGTKLSSNDLISFHSNRSPNLDCVFFDDARSKILKSIIPKQQESARIHNFDAINSYYEVMSILHKSSSKLHHVLGEYNYAWRELSIAMSFHSNISQSYFQKSGKIDLINSSNLELDELRGETVLSVQKRSTLRSLVEKNREIRSQSKLPVFIIGFHNSGVEVLKSLLSNSCNSAYDLKELELNETFYFDKRADSIVRDAAKGEKILSTSLRDLSQDLLLHVKLQIAAREADGANNDANEQEISLLFDQYVHLNQELEKLQGKSITSKWRKKFRLLPSTRVMITGRDLYFYVDVIRSLFPQAVIVNVIRDPMDTIFSCIRNGISPLHDHFFQDFYSFGWSLNTVADFRALIGEYILYLQLLNNFHSTKIIDIQYEAMVADPTGTVKYLANALKVTCDFESGKKHIDMARYPESIGFWTNYSTFLNRTVIATLKPFLLDLIKEGAVPFVRNKSLTGSRFTTNCLNSEETDGESRNCAYYMNWLLKPTFEYSSAINEMTHHSETCETEVMQSHNTAIISEKYLSQIPFCSSPEKDNIEDEAIDIIGNSLYHAMQNILSNLKELRSIVEKEEKVEQFNLAINRSLLFHRINQCPGELLFQATSIKVHCADIQCPYHFLFLLVARGQLLTSLGRGNEAARDLTVALNIFRLIRNATLTPPKYVIHNTSLVPACKHTETSSSIACLLNGRAIRSFENFVFVNCNLKIVEDVELLLLRLQSDALLRSDRVAEALPLLLKLIGERKFLTESVYYKMCYDIAVVLRETLPLEESSRIIRKDAMDSLLPHILSGIGDKNYSLLAEHNLTSCLADNHIKQDDISALMRNSHLFWALFVLNGSFDGWHFLHCAHQIDRVRLNTSFSFEEYLNGGKAFNKFVTSTFTRHFWQRVKRQEQLDVANNLGLQLDRRSFELDKALRGNNLIFIVGFYRSGSTLLETILDSHPSIWGMGENSVLGTFIESFDKDYNSYLTNWEGDYKGERLRIIRNYRHRIYQEIIRRKKLAKEENATVFIDKMLNNYRSIGYIHLLFPDAVILFVVRDPMDTLLSCYTTRFENPLLSYLSANPVLLAREYAMHLQLMAFYLSSLDDRHVLDTILYERLVSNPSAVLNEILEKLDLMKKGIHGEHLLTEYSMRKRTVLTASRFQSQNQCTSLLWGSGLNLQLK